MSKMVMSQLFEHIENLKKGNILLIALILLAIIGLADFATGVELSISIFYLFPIILCSWYIGRKSGLTVSLFSALIWFAAENFSSRQYSSFIILSINAILMLGIFVIISEIFSALRLSIERENQLAIKVQKGLLPKKFPVFDSLQLSVTWKPYGFVSGDYYDFVKLDENKLGVCIADVSGHGVAAALLMANIQAAFRITLRNNYLPQNVFKQLNHTIKQHQLSDKFVSFFYGIIDLDEKSFIYSNAGHPPPVIINKEGLVLPLNKGGTMLGVMTDYYCEYEKIDLIDGDVIMLYTDGLSEAKNQSSKLFGEDNLINVCKSSREYDSHEINHTIINAVNEYNNSYYDDDYTLMVIKYEE